MTAGERSLGEALERVRDRAATQRIMDLDGKLDGTRAAFEAGWAAALAAVEQGPSPEGEISGPSKIPPDIDRRARLEYELRLAREAIRLAHRLHAYTQDSPRWQEAIEAWLALPAVVEARKETMSPTPSQHDAAAAARAILQELNNAMRSPRGDYYQGDVADPHRSLHIVQRHVALALRERERETWEAAAKGVEAMIAEEKRRAGDVVDVGLIWRTTAAQNIIRWLRARAAASREGAE